MVIMVHDSTACVLRDWSVYRTWERWWAEGRMFVGPRAFRTWDCAMAYALLPADTSITLTPRRHVRYSPASERWIVGQTTMPRQYGNRRHAAVYLPTRDTEDGHTVYLR